MSILKYLDLIIPSEWNKVRLATIANIIDPEPSHRAPALADGEGFPYIGIRDVNNDGTVNTVTARPIKEESLIEQEKRFKIDDGDLIFCRVATLGNPKIIKIDKRVALSATLALIKPKREKVNNIFLLYLLDSDYIKLQTELYSTGSTRKSLGMETIRKFEVLVPPLDIQNAIAEYLFEKMTVLDNIIEGKKRSIELLEQQRQSIITEAVTKGLNPNVKMKDSGVEWIGEIPEHWNVTKIKYNTYVKGRIGWQGLKSDEFVDEGPYLVTGTDFKNGYVEWSTCYHISEERYNEAPPIQLKENDLLITKDGTIGKLAIVKDMPSKAILNSGVFVTRPVNEKYLSEYMYWLLSSNVFDKYISLMETGSTIKHLYQETFVNFSYPLPSLKEQEEIVKCLNMKINDIDNIAHLVKEQILKLKEYRQSLIYEAVTGKIDVREMELD
ncbi:restriction endonuclease subunit S [Ureibacillus endophyticus]|uniref:Restriction endonuclease subunit S n=1 Tax=Ureibacillus endophyticus TaxID=1978490 RepID=A0A494Z2L1_9BACL|nr:restriction endonuclease subunit S [Lysinibacillus endophyticus]RKQ16738.1 restriction endonuclease subunit S [Lysinibacillus endophyticus]